VALILIARSGTAIASELGNMKVNKEIDALETMAINPLSYIVFPRLMGGVVSIVCLTFYFSVLALAGGFAMSQLFGDFSLPSYIDALAETLTGMDVAFFFIKSLLNGACVFAIACYYGLSVNQSPHEVPQATTRAVLASISAVGVTTALATLAFYFEALRGLADL
jgi:phospholipid/cholesterol/gamma-HCH transport system permease protein